MTVDSSEVNELIDSYRSCGLKLTPIPRGKKGPTHLDWNTIEKSELPIPPGYNIGLLHTFSGTMALDIDDYHEAAKIIPDIDDYFLQPDAVHIFSGNPGRCKLLYKMPAFIGNLPTRSIKVNHHDVISFRCASKDGNSMQDVLPPSIHPITQQPYQWRGAGHYSKIPIIPIKILTMWRELINANEISSIPVEPTGSDWLEIQSATESINPSCGYEDWMCVGMALHSTGNPAAYQTWNTWSSRSEKYQPGEMANKWNSFKDVPDGITINTLYKMALDNGWVRPIPDVTKLFTNLAFEPLALARRNAPNFDTSVIPDRLRERVKEIALHRGCDPLVPFFAGLAAICAAVDKRTTLTLKNGYIVHPILWLMSIGEPADKKTPGSKPMVEELHALESEDKTRFSQEMVKWSMLEAIHHKQMEAVRALVTDPNFTPNSVAPVVLDLPTQPVPLRLIANDCTSQKLVSLCAPRERGLMVFMDELGGWYNTLTSTHTHGNDRSTWIQGYEGGRHLVDRVTTGSNEITNFAVALYGNVQPVIFNRAVLALSTDGLLQRFIPGILRPELTVKGMPVKPGEFTHENKWNSTLREIFSLPVRNYQLSGKSHAEFDRFQTWFESERVNNRDLRLNNVYMQAFSKLEGTLGRIALVFHLLTDPYNPDVQEDTMKRAIRFIKDYVNPSLMHVYIDMLNSEGTELEYWFSDHIINLSGLTGNQTICTTGKVCNTVSMQQLRRRAKTLISSKTILEQIDCITSIMDYLEKKSWVKLIDGSGKNPAWAINPELATKFKLHRLRNITMQQKKLDSASAVSGTNFRKYTNGFNEAVKAGLIDTDTKYTGEETD